MKYRSLGITALLLMATFGGFSLSARTPESRIADLSPQGQGAQTKQQTSHRFTVKDGNRRTRIKVTVERGKIIAVSGMNGRDTFNFTHVEADARPKLTGGRGQILKCARVRTRRQLALDRLRLCQRHSRHTGSRFRLPTRNRWHQGRIR